MVLADEKRPYIGTGRVAQRDDQMPGECRVVQPVVDAGEVGRLAPVHVERGDRFQSGSLDPLPGAQQVRRVSDEAGVLVGAKVAALGVEGRPVGRVIAPVPTRVEHDRVHRSKGKPGLVGVAREQAVGLQAGAVELVGSLDQP